jgi:NAD(P)-dependent dehydrogenase (short-subunit alcohol dehydrogenase family)
MPKVKENIKMSDRLKNMVAIVTGAGSVGPGWGNGKAAAVLFARHGAKICAVDINLDAVKETKRLIDSEGGNCVIKKVDVTKADEVKKMVEECIETYGRIDILHNNVGIVEVGGPVELSEENWDKVINVNLKSMFLTCKYSIPYMEKQRNGSIINISSIASIRYVGFPIASYNASKGAVNQLTQHIAMQYAEKGIRANCILPGFMNTPMIVEPLKGVYGEAGLEEMIKIRDQQCPMKKMGDAWDVAYAALFLASNESKYITGSQLVVDGGITCKFS